jgi:hypothetical protein
MRRLIVIVLSAIIAMTLAMPAAFGHVGPGAAASATARQLDAAWWSWAVSTPASQSPLSGGDPDYNDAQCNGTPVTKTATQEWFLAGSAAELSEDGGSILTDSGQKRTCDVPAGTHIFFPLVNNFCATPVDADTPEELSECAKTLTDDMVEDASYYVRVDGQDVAAGRIVRAPSSPYTANFYDDPNSDDDNVFAQAGYRGEQTVASDGLYVTLPPLSKGKHTIEWAGIFVWDGGSIYEGGPVLDPFTLPEETTYNITVK